MSKAERDRWGRLMEAYFASGLIFLGVMIVDARHKPTADDVTMANWFFDAGCLVIYFPFSGSNHMPVQKSKSSRR